MRRYVLGIESTAHTFGVGIVDDRLNILADERAVFKPRAGHGIDPGEAAEHHAKVAVTVFKRALSTANISISDIDAIAYSMGPGLGPALRVGATLARALAYKYNIPLYPVHHGLGHVELAANLLKLEDPLIIIVSGGHTAVVAFNYGRWRIYGETLDITLGNLLDVFARELGYPFPGGPAVEELAKKGRKYISLPYTVKGNNVVYLGLLTHVIRLLRGGGYPAEDIAYSLQETAFSMLAEIVERALTQLKKTCIGLTGGVASNDRLFEIIRDMAEPYGVDVKRLDKRLNADNGVQIALTGMLYLLSGYKPTRVENAIVRQRIRIDEVDVPWRTS